MEVNYLDLVGEGYMGSMKYVIQSSEHLPGPSKKSIWITCSRTAETWRTSCAEAEATLQARNMFYAHRVYIRQVRAVGLYFIQPPQQRRENPGHISPVLQDPEYLSFTTAQTVTFVLEISHTSYTGP